MVLLRGELRGELPGVIWYCRLGKSTRESRFDELNESREPARVCMKGTLGGRDKSS